METIIYINGDNYIGRHPIEKIKYWLQFGINHDQKFLYKGYRYFDNQKDIVVVYDVNKWDGCEIEKRRNNGFKGITEYLL